MIKVKDIAYVRFAAPDLDTMERFVRDFGLVVTARGDDVLYARGTDPSPYVHVTERGEPGFRGVAFEAASSGDLDAAAALPGASDVEKIDAPGGGRRVRFTDPDGFEVGFNCTNDRYVNDEEICQAITSMWARLGVKAHLTAQTKSKHFEKMLAGDGDRLQQLALHLDDITPRLDSDNLQLHQRQQPAIARLLAGGK